jgi:hypothetical protein
LQVAESAGRMIGEKGLPFGFPEADQPLLAGEEERALHQVPIAGKHGQGIGEAHFLQLLAESLGAIVLARGVEQPADIPTGRRQHPPQLGNRRRGFADGQDLMGHAPGGEKLQGLSAGVAAGVGVNADRWAL